MNARSLANKLDQLEAILLGLAPDIVAVTETWLHSSISDSNAVPSGYAIVRKDRGSRGGGVALLFKDRIRFSVMPDVTDVEALWCNVYLKNKTAKVGVVYRPPNADNTYLESFYDYMHSNVHGGSILLAGDFNLPEIDWYSLSPENKTESVLIDIMLTFNLDQLVRAATRVQGASSSILDLIFVSNDVQK